MWHTTYPYKYTFIGMQLCPLNCLFFTAAYVQKQLRCVAQPTQDPVAHKAKNIFKPFSRRFTRSYPEACINTLYEFGHPVNWQTE